MTLSEACGARDITAGQLALHLDVHVETARRWLAGAPVPERHAKALIGLLGRETVRALTFAAPRPKGPHAALGPALERAARALRRAEPQRRGDLELAAVLDKRAAR